MDALKTVSTHSWRAVIGSEQSLHGACRTMGQYSKSTNDRRERVSRVLRVEVFYRNRVVALMGDDQKAGQRPKAGQRLVESGEKE